MPGPGHRAHLLLPLVDLSKAHPADPGWICGYRIPAARPLERKAQRDQLPRRAPLLRGRWLRDTRILDDYGRYWFRKGGSPRQYSFWAADAVYAQFLVTGSRSPAVGLLPDLVENYEAWEKSRRDANGLFWQKDVLDGMEVSIGGDGYRATINSILFGDAQAIAELARMAGDRPLSDRFRAKAAEIKRLVQELLWDADARFFKVAPRLEAIPPMSAGILEWQVNGSPDLARAAVPSASYCGPGDTVRALHDGQLPKSSGDRAIPRLTFQDHRGTREWVQYDFPQPVEVRSVAVYWAQDDSGCRLPAGWQLFFRQAGRWQPAPNLERYRTDADRFASLQIQPVTTDGLRIELQCQGVKKPFPQGRLPLADVRELHGYTPWYFNLPDPAYAAAWKQLMDPGGFFAPFGPTTAEQRHPGFRIAYDGHPCQWNGPSWPFSTAVTLTALANVLHRQSQDYVIRADYLTLLRNYARSHMLRRENGPAVPWIDESLHPFTGEWLTRTILLRREAQPLERGKDYNHSTFCDLVISGLVGLRPRADDTLELDPLVPQGQWNWFCLDRVSYHGRLLTILWDKTGQCYRRGAGFRILADGREIGRSRTLQRMQVPLR